MRTAWSVALSLFLSAGAALAAAKLPEVSARAPRRALDINLTAPEEHGCAGAIAPEPWKDASDPFWFATGPTARLDEQELAVGSLTSLISARILLAVGVPRLLVLGTPLRAGLHFSSAGWRPRWPFC